MYLIVGPAGGPADGHSLDLRVLVLVVRYCGHEISDRYVYRVMDKEV